MPGIAQSPTVTKKKVDVGPTMTFPQAVQAVIDKEEITKLEWGDADIYATLRNGKLMIHLKDGWHQWIINDGDLFGDDWVIR